jgi:hypothetical protein
MEIESCSRESQHNITAHKFAGAYSGGKRLNIKLNPSAAHSVTSCLITFCFFSAILEIYELRMHFFFNNSTLISEQVLLHSIKSTQEELTTIELQS